jgi:hypothetical protein
MVQKPHVENWITPSKPYHKKKNLWGKNYEEEFISNLSYDLINNYKIPSNLVIININNLY